MINIPKIKRPKKGIVEKIKNLDAGENINENNLQ